MSARQDGVHAQAPSTQSAVNAGRRRSKNVRGRRPAKPTGEGLSRVRADHCMGYLLAEVFTDTSVFACTC